MTGLVHAYHGRKSKNHRLSGNKRFTSLVFRDLSEARLTPAGAVLGATGKVGWGGSLNLLA